LGALNVFMTYPYSDVPLAQRGIRGVSCRAYICTFLYHTSLGITGVGCWVPGVHRNILCSLLSSPVLFAKTIGAFPKCSFVAHSLLSRQRLSSRLFGLAGLGGYALYTGAGLKLCEGLGRDSRGGWGFPASLTVCGTCDVFDGTDDTHNREPVLEELRGFYD